MILFIDNNISCVGAEDILENLTRQHTDMLKEEVFRKLNDTSTNTAEGENCILITCSQTEYSVYRFIKGFCTLKSIFSNINFIHNLNLKYVHIHT